MNTLVLHLADPSTDFLKAIYEGMGYPVITGPVEPQELKQRMQAVDRLFMLGHGAPAGLFASGYLIDDEFGPILAQKRDGLYIWCHADEYAARNKLTGIVSGMFISEVGEAAGNGIRASQAEVDASNNAFSAAVRDFLDNGHPPERIRQCYSSATCLVTQFNNSRLYVFQNGISTPQRYEDTEEYQIKHPKPKRSVRDQEREEREEREMEQYRSAIDDALDALDPTVFQDAAAMMGKRRNRLDIFVHKIASEAGLDEMLSAIRSHRVANFAYDYAEDSIVQRIRGGVQESARQVVASLLD